MYLNTRYFQSLCCYTQCFFWNGIAGTNVLLFSNTMKFLLMTATITVVLLHSNRANFLLIVASELMYLYELYLSAFCIEHLYLYSKELVLYLMSVIH